ncbi:MAG: hypothetical protein IBJ11_09105, partial [Phycisphaerales bacterium]|nr:hypothetical protein [Phycisphaerales bacterium]
MPPSGDHDRERAWPLAVGLLFSLAAHLLLAALLTLVPGGTLFARSSGSLADARQREAERRAKLPEVERRKLEQLERERPPIRLGNPDSTAITATWIGFDEFKQHYTLVKSETDQPALTVDPPAGRPTPAPPLASQSAPAPSTTTPPLPPPPPPP